MPTLHRSAALPPLWALIIMVPSALAAQTPGDSLAWRRRVQPLPAIGASPETGLQLGATVLGVFEPPRDRLARPAALIASAVRSNRGQLRTSAEGEYWTKGNSWRFHGLLAWQSFPMPYHGIGDRSTSDSGMQYGSRSVEAVITTQRRLRGARYATAGARGMQQTIRNGDDVRALVATPEPVGVDGGTVMEANAGVLHDSRDGLFAPRSGGLTQVVLTTSLPGSTFDYQRLRVDTRRYFPIGHGQVLALHAVALGTSNGAPFDQVAFAGVGAVSEDLAGFQDALPLPTYGAGLRYQLDAVQRTAIRVDYGRGKRGASGLYIGFNQAF